MFCVDLGFDLTVKGLYFTFLYFFNINMGHYPKFKSNADCVGVRYYSGTINIHGFVSTNGTKMLKLSCTNCKRNKSMTVSDATIEAEGLKISSRM